MSHYDCKNCGSYLGIDFGKCTNCTPEEYFEISKKLRNRYSDLKNLYTKEDISKVLGRAIAHGIVNKSFDETVKHLIEEDGEIKRLRGNLRDIEDEQNQSR